MANFATHCVGGVVAGVGGAVFSLLWRPDNLAFAGACLVAGFVGGMLPDIDHDEAIPIREVFSILAAVVPACLMPMLVPSTFNTEQAICFFAATYAAIRWPVSWGLKRLTVHRGIFHSIPFCLVAGLFVAIVLNRLGPRERLLLGGSVSLGALAHLILDEVFAVNFLGAKLKKSFGTALKLWSGDLVPTLLCYGSLALLTYTFVARFGTFIEALKPLHRVLPGMRLLGD